MKALKTIEHITSDNIYQELTNITVPDNLQDELLKLAIEWEETLAISQMLENNKPSKKVHDWFIKNVDYEIITSYGSINFINHMSLKEFKTFLNSLKKAADEDRVEATKQQNSFYDYEVLDSNYLTHFYQKTVPKLDNDKSYEFMLWALKDKYFFQHNGDILKNIIKNIDIRKELIPILFNTDMNTPTLRKVIYTLLEKAESTKNIELLELMYATYIKKNEVVDTIVRMIARSIQTVDINNLWLMDCYEKTGDDKYLTQELKDIFFID